MRVLLTVLALALFSYGLASCGPVCNPETCGTCCTSDGLCVMQTSDRACGVSGFVCTECFMSESCLFGRCISRNNTSNTGGGTGFGGGGGGFAGGGFGGGTGGTGGGFGGGPCCGTDAGMGTGGGGGAGPFCNGQCRTTSGGCGEFCFSGCCIPGDSLGRCSTSPMPTLCGERGAMCATCQSSQTCIATDAGSSCR